jgi:ubiquinone/menaquinone biosynthesis C-methylase UbiE
MSTSDVSVNYSQTGSQLIEKIYSDDYLSIGGRASTDDLAAEAGVTAKTRVLDVGSGLGGPALHLAASKGCHVTGLDIVASNIDTALERAKARSLDNLVDFRLGDATAMPFEDGQFDVILGQDAWCHVPDKDQLIAECARVMVPGGTVAFTDWLQVGAMDGAYLDEVLSAMASPSLATLVNYGEMLERHGLAIVKQEDISATFMDQYSAIYARLENLEGEISKNFSPKVYGIILAKNNSIRRAFADGKMGGGRIIAKLKGNSGHDRDTPA